MRQVGDTLVWLAMITVVVAVVYLLPDWRIMSPCSALSTDAAA